MTTGVDKLVTAVVGSSAAGTGEAKRRQFNEYIQRFLDSASGWRVCTRLLFDRSGELAIEYFCLRAFGYVLDHRASELDEAERALLRRTLYSYAGQLCGRRQAVELRNKLAQVFVQLFRDEPPPQWEAAMLHWLAQVKGSSGGDAASGMLDLFLRLLLQFHAGVVKPSERQSDPGERKIYADIKDALKPRVVPQLCQLWLDLLRRELAATASPEDRLVRMALKLVGKFVGWIDIRLVVNQAYLDVLLRLIKQRRYVAGCLQCYAQLLKKGMRPAAKLRLIGHLRVVELLALVRQQCTPLLRSDDAASRDRAVDILVPAAKIAANAGVEVLHAMRGGGGGSRGSDDDEGDDDDDKVAKQAVQLLHQLLPLELWFFECEWDDVSEVALLFVGTYVELLNAQRRRAGSRFVVGDFEAKAVRELWRVLFAKYQCLVDDDDDDDDGGDDEQRDQFELFRKKLRPVVVALTRFDARTGAAFLRHAIESHVLKWQTAAWPRVEAALEFAQLFTEGLSVRDLRSADYRSFLSALTVRVVSSHVAQHQRSDVACRYFELCLHLNDYLPADKPPVVELLLQQFLRHGLRNRGSAQVRGRCCYLFERLVLARCARWPAKLRLGLARALLPLLRLQPGQAQRRTVGLSCTDQGHLFEAAARLLSVVADDGNDDDEQQLSEVAARVVTPLRDQLSQLVQSQRAADGSPLFSEFVADIVQSLGAFAVHLQCSARSDCPALLGECIELATALAQATRSPAVRRELLLLLRRSIGCLKDAVVGHVGAALRGLLLGGDDGPAVEPEDVVELLRFFTHLCAGYAQSAARLLRTLLRPLLTLVLRTLQTPTTPLSDEARSVYLVRQAYGNFVHKLVAERLARLFLTDDNRPAVKHLMQSMVAGLAVSDVEPRSYAHAKQCLAVVNGLLNDWWHDIPELRPFALGSVLTALFKFFLDPRLVLHDSTVDQLLLDVVRLFHFLAAACPDGFAAALTQLSVPPAFLPKVTALAQISIDDRHALNDGRQLLKALFLRRAEQA